MKKFTLLFAFALLAIGNSVFGQIAQRGTATSASTTNTTLTINKPTGVVAGDVMIANIAQGGNNTTAPSLAGWTLVAGGSLAGGTERYGIVLYRVADGTEGASFSFTLGSGTDAGSGSIVAFSGVGNNGVHANGSAGGPFDVDPAATLNLGGSGATTATATGITTASANAAVIMFTQAAGENPSWSGWTTTSPGGLTELYDNANGSNTQTSVGAAWATKASAGATGNGTATLSIGERNGAILVALKVGAPSATLTPAANQNIAVGSSINFTATANNYGGSGNYTFTWAAVGATGVGTNPVVQAGNSNAKLLTFNTPGTYTIGVSIARTGNATLVTNLVNVNVFAAPLAGNMWASSSSGTQISTFWVNGGVNFTAGGAPINLFAASFPGSTTGGTTTAAIARTDKPSQALGHFYWLPNVGTNGIVEVFGATSTGGTPTRIGTLDVNGAGTNSLGFVRLGAGPDGTCWILAGDNSTLYLAKFKPNGLTVNGSLPAADQLTVVDASVTLTGGAVSTFQNGDICIAGDGNIVALANDGGGITQIFVGSPNGSSTTLAKKFDVLDENSAAFTGSVNGVAFDVQGSLYVSSSDGLYFIDKNTVNGPAGTISIFQTWAGTGLQDLGSNFFPTTIITPVKLGSFEVMKSGNNAVLNWTTLTETNSDRFEIERSFDGINFSVVGAVQAAGNSNDLRSYQFVDPITTGAKIIYYRLKTVDIDAKSSLSKIVALRLNGASVTGFNVYPNPFTSDLKMQIVSEKETVVTLRISNALGQPVVNRNVTLQTGENIVVLATELAALNRGMYVLEVISEEGKQALKIIKR
jgi:hypothetical protein